MERIDYTKEVNKKSSHWRWLLSDNKFHSSLELALLMNNLILHHEDQVLVAVKTYILL